MQVSDLNEKTKIHARQQQDVSFVFIIADGYGFYVIGKINQMFFIVGHRVSLLRLF
jgi:hypothetical protein